VRKRVAWLALLLLGLPGVARHLWHADDEAPEAEPMPRGDRPGAICMYCHLPFDDTPHFHNMRAYWPTADPTHGLSTPWLHRKTPT
jgi:hypothetical protein